MRFSAFVALRLFAELFLKRFPAGVLAACSASRAARFGCDAGKNPCGWHGEDQSTTRRDRRSEAFVLDLNRSHPAGVSRGKGKKAHSEEPWLCTITAVAPVCACVRIRCPRLRLCANPSPRCHCHCHCHCNCRRRCFTLGTPISRLAHSTC